MTARAICPECGKTLHVRADHRLPRHWESRAHWIAGEPRCSGSELKTRRWSTGDGGVLYQRQPRT